MAPIAAIEPLYMFLAGVALLTIILMKRAHRYFGPRNRKRNVQPIEKVARPTSTWDGAQRDQLAVIERQKVEMHEMSRDLNGELSSKIIVLEQLIGESQKQIDRLEKLLAQADEAGTVKSEE